ncbi:MAG: DegT/DnrJ/EryC1/StrS family aminotransferase [Candidatus Eiseniibacteriota bacterium]
MVFPEPIYVSRPLLPDLKQFTAGLEEVWSSGWLTNNGPQHGRLESALAEYLRVPHLSLFNNGTIALIVACQSLRLSGEVITTPFTFPATPHVLSWNNIRPIFCDIDPVTMNIDASRIESLITPQTTGILAVHVFGNPCDVDALQEVADRYGLKLIYDAAHAFGAEVDGRAIGNFGDISMFSFHATKLFHTAEGGALSLNHDNLKPRVDLLKNFGIKNEFDVVMPGINGKMNELQALMGLCVLDRVEEERAQRQLLYNAYVTGLEDIEGVSFAPVRPGTKSSLQYFAVRIDARAFGVSRDEVYERFKEYNVFSRKYFYPLCSDYSCYHHLPSAAPAHLPVAQRVVSEVLCLPFYGGLQVHDVENICTILRSLR